MKIPNCFDSHVHWLETGASARRLSLSGLKKAEDVKTLDIKKENFLGHWLMGFGWDEHNWPRNSQAHRKILDEVFDHPVCFYRTDFHALWLNTLALKEVGLYEKNLSQKFSLDKGRIFEDEEGLPTGVLVEGAFSLVEERKPKASCEDIRCDLLKGMEIFNQAGFSHIRDFMAMDTPLEQALKIEKEGQLTLAVETYFYAQDDFARSLNKALEVKSECSSEQLRFKGLKIFLDGALGLEGAYLSKNYKDSNHSGFLLFSFSELKERLEVAWEYDLEVAVHCIGDESSHQLALATEALFKNNKKGKLHVEHGEVLRKETIRCFKKLGVRVHMQPCHFLTDKKWLYNKLGSFENVFNWSYLEEKDVKFDFGSDSPIESPSLFDTQKALKEAHKKGILPIKRDWWLYHSHEDSHWVSDTYTEVEDFKKIKRLVFKGKTVAFSMI